MGIEQETLDIRIVIKQLEEQVVLLNKVTHLFKVVKVLYGKT